MLSEKQLSELREHLERAQNPIFFYDNDADGFCSFVLLRRFLGRGKGVAVRSHPDIELGYARKARELNADYVFVLDRPFLGEAFVKEISELGLPIVWIDHHDVPSETYENVHVFNPAKNSGKMKSEEPVTYWCYQATQKQEDIWIAIMGCIADHYLPDFASIFKEQYPELWGKKVKVPFDAYYGTDIGKVARALGYGLKDSVTHVVYLQNLVVNSKSAHDMLLELEGHSSFARKYAEIKKKYDELMPRAKTHKGNKLLFFSYGGQLSISSDLANELSYLYPKHVIAVAYTNGSYANLSLRGPKVRDMLEKIIGEFEGGRGGGHMDAVGARIKTGDLERFKTTVQKYLST
jgi:single-stranded DNA-specific DHH superfamily exonuclease